MASSRLDYANIAAVFFSVKICIDYTLYGHIVTIRMLWLATLLLLLLLLFFPPVFLSMLNARQTMNKFFFSFLTAHFWFSVRVVCFFVVACECMCMCGVDNDSKSID